MPSSALGSAQAAAAQAVLDRPKVEALFPQLEQSKPPSQSPQPRSASRLSRSQPFLPSSFGKASSALDRANASELSAATTAFVAASFLGSAVQSDLAADRDALANLADAVSSVAPSASPPKLNSLPYKTETESSVVSDWRQHYWKESGKGVAFSRGLRFLDLSHATADSPGVCVIRAGPSDVPKAPKLDGQFGPAADKQRNIDAVTKQLAQMGVVLTEHHHYGQAIPEKNSRSLQGSPSASRISIQSVSESSPSRLSDMGRRSASEASLESYHERRKHLPARVARERYQKYIVSPPRKGHRHMTPQRP